LLQALAKLLVVQASHDVLSFRQLLLANRIMTLGQVLEIGRRVGVFHDVAYAVQKVSRLLGSRHTAQLSERLPL
jgi:hypothetical protein